MYRRAERRQPLILEQLRAKEGLQQNSHAFERGHEVTPGDTISCGSVAGLRTASNPGHSVARSSMMSALPQCLELIAFGMILMLLLYFQ